MARSFGFLAVAATPGAARTRFHSRSRSSSRSRSARVLPPPAVEASSAHWWIGSTPWDAAAAGVNVNSFAR